MRIGIAFGVALALGCGSTERQQRICSAADSARRNSALDESHYDYGGANPCGYDRGSQAAEPDGP